MLFTVKLVYLPESCNLQGNSKCMSCSFCMFPCSKKHLVTAYIKTILNDFRPKKVQHLSLDSFVREQFGTLVIYKWP